MNQAEIKNIIQSHLIEYDPLKVGIFGSGNNWSFKKKESK
jgi:hypothetical protein